MIENPQLPWTEQQWDRVQEVVREEARKARIAASFMPIVGPLPADADYVSRDTLTYTDEDVDRRPPDKRIVVEDTVTQPLSTLEVRVQLRGPQVADPELTSALQMFRRAANAIARLEDAFVFAGRKDQTLKAASSGLPEIWRILPLQGEDWGLANSPVLAPSTAVGNLVSDISAAIGILEARGQPGPFACVLDQRLFNIAQTPNANSLVLPQDRIIPFLNGGPLLRCSALDGIGGLVIALGGAAVDLVLAKDVSVTFLQVTLEPRFVFRVYEKLALRFKQPDAVVVLREAEASK